MSLPLGIVVALPIEAAVLTNLVLTQNCPVTVNSNVRLILSGVGAENAENSALQLIEQGISALLSFGTAAGISPACHAGDVLIADSCIDDNKKSWQMNTPWRQNLCHLLGHTNLINLVKGSLCESHHVVATRTEKQKLFVSTRAVALDMETAALARVTDIYSIPFLSLRAIVDTADMHIPVIVTNAMDLDGNVNNKKIIQGLIRDPGSVLPLIQLARNFHLAKKALTNCKNIAGLNFGFVDQN